MKQTDSSQHSSKKTSKSSPSKTANSGSGKESQRSFFDSFRQKAEEKIGPFSFQNSRFLIVVVFLVLCVWFTIGTLLHDTSIEAVDRSTKPVRVKVIESTAVEKTTYYTLQGTLEALNKVTLRAETTGVVKNIVADKGTSLIKGEAILNLSFDSRLSKLREAQALVEQRQLEYENAKKLLSGNFRSKTDVANSKSQLESAQAALEQIQEDIDDTKITAPFNGTVDRRHVEIGDYIRVGDPLVEFVSLNPLLGVVNVAEKDIHLMKLGTHCLIDCREVCHVGEITFISKIADPNTRTYQVEIEVKNPSGDIPDGLTAAIHIPIETSPAHLFSPAAIAMDEKGRPGIKIVTKDNVVEFVGIDILNHDQTGIWVRGLPDHVRIITVGQFFIQPGDTVDPIVVKAPEPSPTLAEDQLHPALKKHSQKKIDRPSSEENDQANQPLMGNEAPTSKSMGMNAGKNMADGNVAEDLDTQGNVDSDSVNDTENEGNQ